MSQPTPALAPHVTAAPEPDPHSTLIYITQPPQSHVPNAPALPPPLSAPISRGVLPRPRLGLLIKTRPASPRSGLYRGGRPHTSAPLPG
eukprot:6197332-Pleurochrysis_carterae.AAC.1